MTPHWSELRNELRHWLQAQPRILIGCDFDGTLTPLVAHPDAAHLPAATRGVLQRLMSLPGVSLAFISGRSLADLQQRIAIPGALYAGNHGLEMTGPDGASMLVTGMAESLPWLAEVRRTLTPRLASLPGAWIEDKHLTLSIHYRLVAQARHAEIERLVRHALPESAPLILRSGKCVWEIRPAIPWDKGCALRLLMHQQQVPASATAFMGDDVTDGDAFRELPQGWAFQVGNEQHHAARAFLRDPSDSAALLEWMADVRAASSTPLTVA